MISELSHIADANRGNSMKERPILFSAPMVRALLDDRKTQTRRMVRAPAHTETIRANHAHDDLWVCERPSDGLCTDIKCPFGKPGDRLWVRETWQLANWDWEDSTQTIRFQADGAKVACDMGDDEAETDFMWLIKQVDKIAALPGARWLWEDGTERKPPCEGCTLDWDVAKQPWKPSIFMPRWASRITLEIASVRVERLQVISGTDALAEGIEHLVHSAAEPGCYWKNYQFETAHPKNGLTITDEQHRTLGFMNPVRSYRSLWDSLNAKRGFGWETNPFVWAIEFKRVAT